MATVKQIKKGQPGEELPLFRPQGRDGLPIPWLGLRQVIAEGSEHHVVVGLRLEACSTGPTALGDIRILNAPAEATLGSLVELVPETRCPFLDDPDVSRAST